MGEAHHPSEGGPCNWPPSVPKAPGLGTSPAPIIVMSPLKLHPLPPMKCTSGHLSTGHQKNIYASPLSKSYLLLWLTMGELDLFYFSNKPTNHIVQSPHNFKFLKYKRKDEKSFSLSLSSHYPVPPQSLVMGDSCTPTDGLSGHMCSHYTHSNMAGGPHPDFLVINGMVWRAFPVSAERILILLE